MISQTYSKILKILLPLPSFILLLAMLFCGIEEENLQLEILPSYAHANLIRNFSNFRDNYFKF